MVVGGALNSPAGDQYAAYPFVGGFNSGGSAVSDSSGNHFDGLGNPFLDKRWKTAAPNHPSPGFFLRGHSFVWGSVISAHSPVKKYEPGHSFDYSHHHPGSWDNLFFGSFCYGEGGRITQIHLEVDKPGRDFYPRVVILTSGCLV